MGRLLPLTTQDFFKQSTELIEGIDTAKIQCLASSMELSNFCYLQSGYVRFFDRFNDSRTTRKIPRVNVVGLSKTCQFFATHEETEYTKTTHIRIFECGKTGSRLSTPSIQEGNKPLKTMTHKEPVTDIVFGDVHENSMFTFSQDGIAIFWAFESNRKKLGFSDQSELKPRELFAVNKKGSIARGQCFGISPSDEHVVIASSTNLAVWFRETKAKKQTIHKKPKMFEVKYEPEKICVQHRHIICRSQDGIEKYTVHGNFLKVWKKKEPQGFIADQLEVIDGKLVATTTSGGITVLTMNLDFVAFIPCSTKLIKSSLDTLLIVMDESNAIRAVTMDNIRILEAITHNKRR
uniref:WD_REPEATS_REGION domain-containing protein n=1 Tax=Panagrellus redivivus TaxID=6233 RepID=A0A7E4UT70_PANRE